MAVFWISFRIGYDNEQSYSRRFNGLEIALDTIAARTWKSTTSFWLIEADVSGPAIARSVLPALDVRQDQVLIGAVGFGGGILVGTTDDLETLKQLLDPLQIYNPPPGLPPVRPGLLGL